MGCLLSMKHHPRRLFPCPSHGPFSCLRRYHFVFGGHRFNQAKPKSEVEARVYEVLSHKNWGSSSTLMNEIARDSFDYDKCE